MPIMTARHLILCDKQTLKIPEGTKSPVYAYLITNQTELVTTVEDRSWVMGERQIIYMSITRSVTQWWGHRWWDLTEMPAEHHSTARGQSRALPILCFAPCPQWVAINHFKCGPSQYPTGLHTESVLVRRAGLTAFAAYLKYKWRENAAAGIYRNNLLNIITFRQVWEKTG